MSVGNEKIRDLIIFWGKLRHHSTPKFLRQNELDVGQRMRGVGDDVNRPKNCSRDAAFFSPFSR